ncbi:agmatine deiminase family protein [Rhizobium sp. PL01]|uniref:agmatine deiminase family protein n=1 Tax=Rhizobium sp. PL01 TaxID=3085631 RepID=UPI0029813428|nr:agmatine deiminase family protein [Rhizobium sp. PL01]MDW5318237.1 agmatine deiminase family protein [Rhizobium sp. PL01]
MMQDTTGMATPKQSGFRMPAEWEHHTRSWMMWPARAGFWDDIAATKRDYAAVAHAIRAFEPVTMAVRPEDAAEARSMLGGDIELAITPIDDSWARDTGPCFVVDDRGTRAGVNFEFNAWGGKYHPHDKDNAFASYVLAQANAPTFNSRLVAEGGGLSVDGEGTILTTKSCFPNINRNPDWSQDEIESELKEMLGGDKVIWLPGNPEEIETDGHVDGIAAFVAPGVVLIEAGDADSPWHAINKANIQALEGQTDAKGRRIKLITIPEALEAEAAGDRFCRSYVNSYLVNGGVIMPQYGIRSDDLVRETFEALFPDRTVRQVPIANIAIGGGGIHCITQQEPST